jgi:hypothetical protein
MQSNGKDVENRSWPPPKTLVLPARIAVHAAGAPWYPYRKAVEEITRILGDCPRFVSIPRGAIIGTVEVVGVGPHPTSPWAGPVAVHWLLAKPRPIDTPIPCKGALGLWDVPADILERLVVSGVAEYPSEPKNEEKA